jgi:hypothetical protein
MNAQTEFEAPLTLPVVAQFRRYPLRLHTLNDDETGTPGNY